MYIDIDKLILLCENNNYAILLSKLLDITLSNKEIDISNFNKIELLAWNTLIKYDVITTHKKEIPNLNNQTNL